MAETGVYGKPGTQDLVVVDGVLGSPGPSWVKMSVIEPPKDGGLYVISPDGTWERSMDNDVIRAERQKRYLEVYPVAQQLEAMMDKENGDATKWNEMQKAFEKIRELLPYVGGTPKL